ncbi:GDP-mannose 4,6-dehydratase [Acetobacterium woodii]|uniref:UDP-glucuronate 5'-epimerase LspL n=1 Tax=Acetobacterium woodii (strain ATCC 29683 / DSM 1030 / JCM 2381 / KCTC 1655 / WB1) TaxID=931626 RepID=H6LBB3_ACEWD|nr:NAD-dependent epimerase/dehydratase family protein [Acetobacterium woodii]AFA48868.1 UDP-glucuronate 5'-epimerase LspL [Acetobacterium woodii DSM 1030]
MSKEKSGKTILVTGAAGFIGFHLARKLLEKGYYVLGIDNINDYYDVKLKFDRLEILEYYDNFNFIKGDITDKEMVMKIFEGNTPTIVVNLAAQAGVRNSIENPDVYIESNVVGFFNILEACRNYPVKHLVYASSSSVYGANIKVPFEEADAVDHPVSLYAATKKTNELMAYTYSYLYKIPATGLRFFTVYGPFGRPDMAYFGFVNKYIAGEPINIFNNGDFKNDLYRDFTYVDDIVEGIERVIVQAPVGEIRHNIFNIGNNKPIKLMTFIETLEKTLGNALDCSVVFDKIFQPLKPGDVKVTYASIDKLYKAVGFKPSTSIEEGLQEFSNWYVKYYQMI